MANSMNEKYSAGDCVGVLLDYDEQTLAFFKNGKQQVCEQPCLYCVGLCMSLIVTKSPTL